MSKTLDELVNQYYAELTKESENTKNEVEIFVQSLKNEKLFVNELNKRAEKTIEDFDELLSLKQTSSENNNFTKK